MKLHQASAFAIAAVLAPLTSYAQTEQPPTESDRAASRVGIDQIVVTAEKREENLQDSAIAISAFEGDALEDRGIDDISNLQSYVPGLHVGQEQDGFKISLRGIGLQGTSSISDPGVAFYIDNFYIPRPSGGSAVFYDIDRIEVLRGPQGTLYGRNATGGVVNVISNEPSFDYEGQVGASYGARNMWEVRGTANVPLSDSVTTRFSVVRTEEDGYIKNLSTAPGTEDFFGTEGDLTARGQLLFEAQNDLRVLFSATYSKLNGTGLAMSYLERNIGGPPPTQALLATLPPDLADPLTVNNDSPAYNDTETLSAFVRVEKTFGGVDVFLQAGKFWQDTNILQDFDGSPVNISVFNKDQENDAHSVEFRLSSNSDGPFEWIVGAYYFAEDTHIFRRVRLNGLTPGGVIMLPDFLLNEFGDSSTVAGFGTATYSLTDRFRVTGGVRYTADKKSGSLSVTSNFGAPLPPDLVDVETPFTKVTWKGGLEYDLGDFALTYFNVSSGYKAGGFNITSNGAPYNEENIIAYEAGIKSNPFGGRAQINIDGFYYAYDDMQLTTLTTINNAPGQFTTNAAGATIYGIEFDGQFELAESLLATLTYSYINAEFDEYYNTDPRDPAPVFNPNDPAGLGREDLSGNKVPYV
ncbi:MAG: TonB-dependent receptor, partial [Amphiplicatus sp.]